GRWINIVEKAKPLPHRYGMRHEPIPYAKYEHGPLSTRNPAQIFTHVIAPCREIGASPFRVIQFTLSSFSAFFHPKKTLLFNKISFRLIYGLIRARFTGYSGIAPTRRSSGNIRPDTSFRSL